jgi:Leucine-rich repeat (LRR) protein
LQLEQLNLAGNNLSTLPADLRQFVALRTLSLDGNPLEKIADGDLVQPLLQACILF